eukprot:8628468-Prorocentrum_lima.AAC.1
MPLTGNGKGDFAANVWAFGSEGSTNTGYSGTVQIYGILASGCRTATREDLLFSAEGADSAYSNTWLGWFNTGSHGAAKRRAYDE